MGRCPGSLKIVKALAWIGPVDLPQSVSRRDQVEPTAYNGRDGIGQIRRQILESGVYDPSEPARGQASLASGFVNRHDASDLQRSRQFLLGRIAASGGCCIIQNFKLWLYQLQLAAIQISLHLAVESDYLTGLKTVTQVGCVEPNALQPGPSLSSGHFEYRHTPGAEKARSSDFGDDRRHFPSAKLGNAAGIEAIFVAKWQIMKQIVDRVNSLGRKHVGQSWTYALDILNRSTQFEHVKSGC